MGLGADNKHVVGLVSDCGTVDQVTGYSKCKLPECQLPNFRISIDTNMLHPRMGNK